MPPRAGDLFDSSRSVTGKVRAGSKNFVAGCYEVLRCVTTALDGTFARAGGKSSGGTAEDQAMTGIRHVLIVDEDREARGMLASHLERHGLRVTTATTGAGLYRALGRARIDLVVLDTELRDDDG